MTDKCWEIFEFIFLKCNSSAFKSTNNAERVLNWVIPLNPALSTLRPWAKILQEVSYFHLDSLFGRAWPSWVEMTELSRALSKLIQTCLDPFRLQRKELCAVLRGSYCCDIPFPKAGEKLGPSSNKTEDVPSKVQSYLLEGNSVWCIRTKP